MTTIADYFTNAGLMIGHYGMSGDIRAYEQDEQQPMALGFLLSGRLNLLVAQLTTVYPDLSTYGIVLLPTVIGLTNSLVTPYAKSYLKDHPNEGDGSSALKLLCKTLSTVEVGSNFVLQHSGILVDVACFVSYVALIALGFEIVGIIGLAGLVLIAIKKSGYMPPIVEKFLEPIALIANIVTAVTAPMFIVYRVLQILAGVIACAKFFTGNYYAQKYLFPEWTNHPFKGLHSRPNLTDQDWNKLLNKADQKTAFSVNPKYIYADELDIPLPVDFSEALDNVETDAIFQQVNQKLQDKNITLTDIEKKGFDKLRQGAVTGRVENNLPNNVEFFQKLVKALVESILKDEDNFELKIRELAKIGNNCIEGWSREVAAMLQPKTKDLAWAVHYALAKRREAVVQNTLTNLQGKLKELIGIGFENIAGGANGVHLLNGVQAASYNRTRTLSGNLYFEMHRPHPIEALLLRFWLSQQPDEASPGSDLMYFSAKLAVTHPAMVTGAQIIWEELERDFDNYFDDPENLVNEIYDAIKPQYIQSGGQLEARREIIWEGAQKWQSDRSEKIDFLDDTLKNNPKWLETDTQNKTTLTKAAIRVLLTDFGILQLKDDGT